MAEATETGKHYLDYYFDNPSPIAYEAFDLLSELWHGPHHVVEIVKITTTKANIWDRDLFCSVRFRNELATWDFNEMTRLVFLAHDRCIRVSVSAVSKGVLELAFHKRKRRGGMSQRHPTLEQAVEDWRKE